MGHGIDFMSRSKTCKLFFEKFQKAGVMTLSYSATPNPGGGGGGIAIRNTKKGMFYLPCVTMGKLKNQVLTIRLHLKNAVFKVHFLRHNFHGDTIVIFIKW
uniref:Uncharacterized protein n=1 Tax=Cacopsylla melanoneura TaxID=428564 RepID=A0A8D9DQU1_9HEMI